MKIPLIIAVTVSFMANVATAKVANPSVTLSGTREIALGARLEEVVSRYSLERPDYRTDEEPQCATAVYHYPPLKLWLLALNGRISRIEFEAELGNIPETSYITPEGIRLGSTMKQVMDAYPEAARSINKNSGDIRFRVWRKDFNKGWVFELSPRTNSVVRIFVGDRSIDYLRGCY